MRLLFLKSSRKPGGAKGTTTQRTDQPDGFQETGEACCIVADDLVGDDFGWLTCASQGRKDFQENTDIIFNILFMIETVIKIIAWGFILDSGSYLRDGWNWLDFIVVLVGGLAYLPGVSNVSALRTFRVLRPLRTLSAIPAMRPIVSSLITSVPAMFPVYAFMLFLFTVFGVMGMILFGGTLEGRCHYFDPQGEGNYEMSEVYPAFAPFTLDEANEAPCSLPCAEEGKFTAPWQRVQSPCIPWSGSVCGVIEIDNPFLSAGSPSDIVYPNLDAWADKNLTALSETAVWKDTFQNTLAQGGFNISTSQVRIEVPTFCLSMGKAQYADGWAHFDTFPRACQAIFTSITMEGWVDIMYTVQAAVGAPVLVLVYFMLMVVLLGFFMIELTLAVINDEYDKAAELEEERQALEEAEWAEQHGVAASKKEEDADADKASQKPRTLFGREKKPYGPPPVRFLYAVSEHWAFDAAITAVILANTVCLAMDGYDISASTQDALINANLAFTWIFLGEMIVKMIGLGPWGYAMDGFNIFDFIIVMISLVELGLGEGSGLGALRTFRLLRVFKLAKSLPELKRVMSLIINGLGDAIPISGVLLIVMFIFALIGMQSFGGTWVARNYCDGDFLDCKGDTPVAGFDSLGWSFVTVFQILTGENWNEVMYTAFASSGNMAAFYFVTLNIVGNYMVLNMFLAILLARFEDGDDDDDGAESGGATAKVAPEVVSSGEEEASGGEEKNDEMQLNSQSFYIFDVDHPLRVKVFNLVNLPSFDNFILFLIFISGVLLAIDEPYVGFSSDAECDNIESVWKSGTPHDAECLESGFADCYDAACRHAGFAKTLTLLDVILNILFLIEMLLKMFALGLIMHKHSYLRSGWNILDFVIVIVSFVAMASGGGSVKALRAMRSLRALRPLRAVNRFPQLKIVVNSIFRSGRDIMNVGSVLFLFMLILSITGVQQWAGALNSCTVGDGTTISECIGYNSSTPVDERLPKMFTTLSGDDCNLLPNDAMINACLAAGDEGHYPFPNMWEPLPSNFDNVWNAFLVVYEVASGEMWPDIMATTMDAVGRDEPMREWPHKHGKSAALWYVAVTIMIAFVMINVVVGVVIDNFNQMKDEENGSGLLTESQKLWVRTLKASMTKKPMKDLDPPAPGFKRVAWDIVMGNAFDMFIMGCILFNAIIMTFPWTPNQSQGLTDFFETLNFIFLLIFTAEAIFKLYAMDMRYFDFNWNIFDFSLVVLGFVGMIGSLGPIASLFRIFRLARIIRLVRSYKGVLNIFNTLILSFPSALNIIMLNVLFMFMFAVLGQNIFAGIKHGHYHGLLGPDANFEGFWQSMDTLFRCFTGESFNGIMYDMMVQPPYCDPCDVGQDLKWMNATACASANGEYYKEAYMCCVPCDDKLSETNSDVMGTCRASSNCGYPTFAPIYFTIYFSLRPTCSCRLFLL